MLYKKWCLSRYDSVSKMGLNMVGASVIVPDNSDGTDPENPYADGRYSIGPLQLTLMVQDRRTLTAKRLMVQYSDGIR